MKKNKKRLSQRQRLLNWHYKKSRALSGIELATGDYKRFLGRVRHRLNMPDLDFKTAIKLANEDELCDLEITRDELRLGI